MASLKIEVSGIGYAVGGVKILKGIDARIPDGEITAVVGPSSAGKSTLLRAINRLLEPSSGGVYLDGSRRAPWTRWSCGGESGWTSSGQRRQKAEMLTSEGEA